MMKRMVLLVAVAAAIVVTYAGAALAQTGSESPPPSWPSGAARVRETDSSAAPGA